MYHTSFVCRLVFIEVLWQQNLKHKPHSRLRRLVQVKTRQKQNAAKGKKKAFDLGLSRINVKANVQKYLV